MSFFAVNTLQPTAYMPAVCRFFLREIFTSQCQSKEIANNSGPRYKLQKKLTFTVMQQCCELIQYSQCTYNVTLRRIRAAIFVVENQRVLHILSVCL